ncbi:OmpA family protein [Paraburkholderia phytofirmans]|uniref:OmpA family protein n=2 Tax=Paraburkholderia phytofirmans TaxID=261302 RepID=A0ABW9BAT6_9BURK
MPAASVNIAALSGGGAGPAGGGGGGGTSGNAAGVAGQTDASAASGTVNGAASASANAAAQANQKGTSANATNPSALPAGQTAVFFALGSASLDSQSADALAGVARRLLAAPGSRAVISGYTDSSGSYEANVKLAAARAATVRSALIVAGVDVARIDMRRPARIVASDAPDKSRRVDVTLAPSTGG